jgi:amidase
MAIPKLHNEPGAIELAAQIARGDLSALEATDAAIARIEALDGPINAVVVRDFDRARDAARTADARAADARGVSGPLHGVPMTVKESYNIAGLKTTWGFEHSRDFVADEDAHAVKRMKAAGAIILGKTNVPVALADVQSVNPIYGRTNNPHDLTRVPGGSSGGGAAALAAGMVPLEFGSDIGGSIRTPCHFCGVMGLKPTYGAIPTDGHYFPGAAGAAPVLSMTGPMARTAEDLALALDLTATLPLPRARHLNLKGVRILLLDEHPLALTDAPVADALRGAADAAANAGAIVTHTSPLIPDREAMHKAYVKLLSTAMSTRQPPSAEHPEMGMGEWLRMLDAQADTTRQWQRLFEGFDAILTPVFGTAAFPHTDEPDWHKRSLMMNGAASPFTPQIAWIGQATYPGLPAVSVPVGSDGALPVGIQVITPHWQDHSAIALAGMLHKMMIER